jgi:diguanylate cyclase (GGDEF)-like protein
VRQGGRSLALLHINLDRFKLLNDSLGHDVADQLLQKMARRLVNALPEADTIARLSGDEFAVLFDAYGSLSSLARVATRLAAKLRVPLSIDGHELVVSASMGISMLPDNAREIPALVSQSNMAMQHAKHLGGNNFQFYTDSLQASTLERLQLENQLRKAVEERQLKVYYQPKQCLASGRLNAAEALVRWDHPTMGQVPPAEFIGLAEETGLIGPIFLRGMKRDSNFPRHHSRIVPILKMDQAIRAELIDPSLTVAGRTFKTIGHLISGDGRWRPVYV